MLRAVDLCAAPGSWSQVLSREIYGSAGSHHSAAAPAGGLLFSFMLLQPVFCTGVVLFVVHWCVGVMGNYELFDKPFLLFPLKVHA